MKKLFKYIFIILLLILLAVAAFIYTFDANKYKQEIAAVAGAITGRPVTINGDVDISVYPWIGVKLNDVIIENSPGFSRKDFASIGQFDISVKITPLLQKQLDIDRLVMHRLKVGLEKNAAGVDNWSDFAGAEGSESVESSYGLAGLVIGSIELADAAFTWLDAGTGKQYKISNLSLNTSEIIKGQPLPVTLKAYVESNQPEWQAAISLKSDIKFTENSTSFNANNIKLSVNALMPGKEAEKISFAMVSNSVIDWHDNTAKLSDTRFSIFGLIFSGNFNAENIFSIPTIQGPLKVKTFEAEKLAKNLGMDLPVMANEQSLKSISMSALFKTDFNNIYIDEISADVDASHLKGFVHIERMDHPEVRYQLNVDKIALHDYRSADSESKHEDTLLPLDLIRASRLDGTLDVDNITVDEIELNAFHVRSRIEDGVIQANPVTVRIGESELKAAMVLDARAKPLGKFTVEVNNVDANTSINPLLSTILGEGELVLEGVLRLDANINTEGESIDQQKSSAKGTVKIDMAKVVVQGIDLDYVSRANVAEYANKNNFRTRESYVPKHDPNLKTEFDSLHATFTVSQGKFSNRDLVLVSDQAKITGSGSIDFIKDKLDYSPVIDIKVDDTVDIRDKLRDHPMEYHVHGDFKNLAHEFQVDKYELLVGRLLLQDAKTRRNRQMNTQQKKLW